MTTQLYATIAGIEGEHPVLEIEDKIDGRYYLVSIKGQMVWYFKNEISIREVPNEGLLEWMLSNAN